MKITIGGIEYDSLAGEKLASRATASIDEQLFQTPEGHFFLFILQVMVDGQPLSPYESWIDLRNKAPQTRLSVSERIVPLPTRSALEWCVKTQIPLPFRGYVMESI